MASDPDVRAAGEHQLDVTRQGTSRRCDLRSLAVDGAIFAAYAALSLWWLWPLPRLAGHHTALLQRRAGLVVADLYLILWELAWSARAIATDPLNVFHANSFHPSPLSLAYSEHVLGQLPLFAPVYLATGNPVLAANVMTVATYPLAAIGAYALARRWLGRPAAALTGFFFAFCLHRYVVPPHLYMLGVQWLPAALLFLDRWLERGRAGDAIALAGCLALQCLSSFYLAYAMLFAYAPFLLASLWRWRSVLDRRRLLGVALTAAAAAVPVVATALPYLELRDLGVIPSYGSPEARTQIGLVPFFGTQSVVHYLTSEGVGPVGYALALAALLAALFAAPRGVRWPVILGGLLAAFGVFVSLGPDVAVGRAVIASPYTLLLDIVPGLTTIRKPARFAIIAQLGFALLAGAGIEGLIRRASARWQWTLVAGIVGASLWSFTPFPTLSVEREPAPQERSPAYAFLVQNGAGRPLLEIPAPSPLGAARRMYASTAHWLPIVDGYSGYFPPTAEILHDIARELPGEASLQRLVDHIDLGWILVHLDELPPDARAAWDESLGLPSGLLIAGRFGDDLLLSVSRHPVHDVRSRLRDGDQTLAGTPLATIGGPCPAELRLVAAPEGSWKTGLPAELMVELTNRGDVAFPGVAVYPRHTVRIRAEIRGEDPGEDRVVDTPLSQDVAPGQSLATRIDLRAPRRPGSHRLRLSLFQVKDGPLERCGAGAVEIPFDVEPAPIPPEWLPR